MIDQELRDKALEEIVRQEYPAARLEFATPLVRSHNIVDLDTAMGGYIRAIRAEELLRDLYMEAQDRTSLPEALCKRVDAALNGGAR